ncbi:PQQ-dependent sugar dehydrogenase [Actinomadura oligospora]|uniref:PQQ-dependent sugar dehydrogenase n=1 Tax=Actinomadura oligospora TaxID=111804 RepID=UPI0004BC8FC0|nr:PQQ-dependent sugar dehydrogenase [Actinomadura oligospora]
MWRAAGTARRLAVAVGAVLLGLTGCTEAGRGGDDRAELPGPRTTTRDAGGGAQVVRTVGTGLDAPWDMAFLPDGSALLTERPGRLRRITPGGALEREPVAEIKVAQTFPPAQEGYALTAGLLGLALDPSFASNGFVYLYRTTRRDNEVVRYRYSDRRLSDETVVLTGIPPAGDHVGGRIRFGPDGWLYVTTGYVMDQSTPQNPRSLGGKVLRLSPAAARGTGGRPEIYASGFRNPQGLDWEPGTGRLLVTDHGVLSDDEVDLVRRGANYGWPNVSGRRRAPGFTPPLVLWPRSVAPSGITYVRHPGSAWTGSFLVAALKGESLRRITLSGDRAASEEVLLRERFGRVRAVTEGPDGLLYLLISNRNLGSPRSGDDSVVAIKPPPRS